MDGAEERYSISNVAFTELAGGEAEPAAAPRMTGPDTGPDSPASPADTVSGGTENGEIRLDTVQTEPAVLLPNAGHGPADFGGVTTSTSVLSRTENREIRLDVVQASGSETTKVRHDPCRRKHPLTGKPACFPKTGMDKTHVSFARNRSSREKWTKKH